MGRYKEIIKIKSTVPLAVFPAFFHSYIKNFIRIEVNWSGACLFATLYYFYTLVYRMRHLAFILSIYVVVLTAIPCVDVQIASLESAQQSQQDHHQGEGDHCSPFCTCNCCATSVIFQDLQVHLSSFAFVEKQYTFYATGSYHGPVAVIWQPPKIA